MTSHELARSLLAGPDLPVFVSMDDQYGLLSRVEEVTPTSAKLWQEYEDFHILVDDDQPNVVVISPKTYA